MCTRLARALTANRSRGVVTMTSPKPMQRIAIVGTGTIGASWAAHYLAHGFDVTATDPAPGAEAALRSYVEGAWDGVTTLGLAPGASPDRLKFTSDLPAALADADFVQENGPERPALKVQLFADIDDATPPEAIIASSSSGITMSEIQAQCRRPQRTVIGHPFNPPHVIPLVEVVGGTKTAPETVRDAVAWGPGLRWGVMGPNLLWHLGGGQGGIQHFMDTLMPRMAAGWPGLGNPELTPELQQQIIKGVLYEAHGQSIDELAAQRDQMLFDLIAVRAKQGSPSDPNA